MTEGNMFEDRLAQMIHEQPVQPKSRQQRFQKRQEENIDYFEKHRVMGSKISFTTWICLNDNNILPKHRGQTKICKNGLSN